MKFLNQITEITMKIAKGMIAIFAIKLTLILAVFTFNACSSEDVETSQNNETAFSDALDLSMSNINSIGVFNTNGAMTRTDGSTKTLHLVKEDEQTFNDITFLNSVTDFESLVGVKNERNLTLIEENPIDVNNLLGTYIIDEQPIIDALQPSIQEARNYLINVHHFTNQGIDQMIIDEGGTEEDLVPFVMILTSQEQEQSSASITFNKSLNLFVNSAYAQQQQHNVITWTEVGICVLGAIGVDLGAALGPEVGGKVDKWKMKALTKLFGKVVSRFLGPVGVALAVVSFGTCLAAAYVN